MGRAGSASGQKDRESDHGEQGSRAQHLASQWVRKRGHCMTDLPESGVFLHLLRIFWRFTPRS
jgi:hypothetical protein